MTSVSLHRRPDLVTECLRLRRPKDGDVDAIVRIVRDREVARRLARVPHPYGPADAASFSTGSCRPNRSGPSRCTAAMTCCARSGWRRKMTRLSSAIGSARTSGAGGSQPRLAGPSSPSASKRSIYPVSRRAISRTMPHPAACSKSSGSS